MKLAIVCLAFFLLSCDGASSRAHGSPLIVMLGESTTWGVLPRRDGAQAKPDPALALKVLLRKVPRACPWKGARVIALAAPGSNTAMWVGHTPGQLYCDFSGSRYGELVPTACQMDAPFVDALPVVLGGRKPAAYLVTMGVNDGRGGWSGEEPLTAEETVANLQTLVARLAPVPVYLSPPVPPADPFGALVMEIRQREIDAGMLTGVDWPRFAVPDSIHPTAGGYMAMAGLWAGRLCSQE